jgi:hypothetical protein
MQIKENYRRNETKIFVEGIRDFKKQVTLPIICKEFSKMERLLL